MDFSPALMVLGGLAAGVGIGYGFTRLMASRNAGAAKDAATNIMAEAENAARTLVLQAKDDVLELRSNTDRELTRQRGELTREQEQVARRREKLDERFDQAEQRARALDEREQSIQARLSEVAQRDEASLHELERIGQLSREDARQELLDAAASDARNDAVRLIREIEGEAREEGETRARKILVGTIQRCAVDVVNDIVSSSITLPSDEMKGRIIGRQGRNIRIFEQITGVDVIVDDTPEAITLSCFDPVRREVARLAMLALIEDGRIHPARIEQLVQKTRESLDREMQTAGEDAAFQAGVPHLHKELIKILGRLKYRTSYGQNVLNHSVEVSRLSVMLASEIGADVDLARAGGLLHDIGKALTHEVEGPHALIGGDLCAKYGLPPLIVNAVAAHHHDVEPASLEAIIVETADAISGARPGARRESLELYIKRIKSLENIAYGFDGVEEVYAIQAGREIRILVRPDEVDDLGAIQLSRNIARKVEDTLEYPGQVRVTVIRETRAVDIAK